MMRRRPLSGATSFDVYPTFIFVLMYCFLVGITGVAKRDGSFRSYLATLYQQRRLLSVE
jgi:hypothetical protein